jgi:hypothetical protein
MQVKLLGITSEDFDVIGQQLIRCSISVRYWRKSGIIMVQFNSIHFNLFHPWIIIHDMGQVKQFLYHQVFIDFKKAYDSVRREVFYNILIEFGIPRKLVGLIKRYLHETYS